MSKKAAYILILFAALVIGCEDEALQPEGFSPDLSYFPIQDNSTWTDSIKQIHIDAPVGIYDTTDFVIKTVVDSVEVIDQDELNYYCTEYLFDTAANTWNFRKRFWFNLAGRHLIENYNNLPMLRLVFPLNLGTSWNPYAYTVYSDTTLTNMVTAIHQTKVIDNVLYDSVMTITHRNDSTLIYKYVDRSYFVANKGKVLYESTSILSDDPDFDYTLPIEERIKTADFITIKRTYPSK